MSPCYMVTQHPNYLLSWNYLLNVAFFPGMETGLLGRTEQRRGGTSYYPGQFSVIFRTFFKCLRLYDRIGTREKGGWEERAWRITEAKRVFCLDTGLEESACEYIKLNPSIFVIWNCFSF